MSLSKGSLPRKRPAGLCSTRPVNEIIDWLRGMTANATGIRPDPSFPVATARITSPADDGMGSYSRGRYYGVTLGIANHAESRGDLGESDVSTTASESDDVEVWNLPEITGGGPLRNGDVVVGILGPINSYGYPTVLVTCPAVTPFVVLVSSPSGTNGTATTAANYTYTVKTLDNREIGTGIALARPRPNGRVVTQSSGYGLAFYDGTTLKLWDAGEVPDTGTCPT